MACSTSCSSSTIGRDYVWDWSWELRQRNGWNGIWGVHGTARDSESFNQQFHGQLSLAMAGINHYSHFYGGGGVDWVGNVGVQGCTGGCHNSGMAMDLTAVRFSGPMGVVDSNVHWRQNQSLANQRRYLGIWAGLRRDCSTVLSWAHNSDHHCHFHVDSNGVGQPPPLRQWSSTDRKLIRNAAVLLNGSSISQTTNSWPTAQYNGLLAAFGFNCANLSPTTNYWHMALLMDYIMMHCFANKSAGFYKFATCGGPS